MSTIQTIADILGVSKSTVSRAINQTGYVGENTRNRVLEVAQSLGYKPNLLAKHLSTQQSKCVGLVIANTMFDGHYFNEIVSLCAKKLQARGLNLLLADGKDSPAAESEAIDFLIGLQCDAIILYPHFLPTSSIISLIKNSNIPIVVLNRWLPMNQKHSICCNHEEDSRRVVQELVKFGHKEIAFITGELTSPTAESRLIGYKKGMTECNVDNRILVEAGDWTIASGYRAMKSLVQKNRRLEAVVASNDDMAIGAIRYITEIGMIIPKDISVVGFDDLPVSSFLNPALSSVKPPTELMVETAINQLDKLMTNQEVQRIPLFDSEINARDSIGKRN